MNEQSHRESVGPARRAAIALSQPLVTAALFGLVTFPLATSAAATGLTMLLVAPLAVVASVAVGLAARPAWLLVGRRRAASRWLCLGAVGLLVFAGGAYVSNAALVDDPLQLATIAGYCVSTALAALAALAARARAGRTGWGQKLDALDVSTLLTWLTPVAAVGLSVLDASFLSEGYPSFHLALLVLIVVLLSVFARLSQRPARHRLIAGLALAAIAGWMVAAFLLAGADVYEEAAARPTVDRRLLLLARSLADRDGDGYARAFGGGDCDDRDPRAFPLSATGRDCLGWMGKEPLHADAPLPAASAVIGPRVLLLITVDALRCDTGARVFAGEAELCPELGQLARAGRARNDARTTYPRTSPAIASLHGGVAYAPAGRKRARLARWLAEQGRTTHAVSTHAMQLPDYIARTFDSVDRSLQSKTSSGSATTSREVSARTLDWLGAHQGRPVFIWSHYFDPHSPYVDPPGSRSALSPATRRYAAEVRRTDAEIGALVRQVAALDASLVVVITADHGEEFAEHGNQYHGTTLYEAAVRIPMVLWTPNPALLAGDTELPSTLAEVAPFLVSVGRRERFVASTSQFFWVASHGKRAVGVYQDGFKLTYDEGLGLSALYDVNVDPEEERNLFASAPALRERLGARLASYLAAPAPAD
jgi:Sulfatase